MIKLPEPVMYKTPWGDLVTVDQMRQAIKDALEESIDVIETANARRVIYLPEVIDLIRKLKEDV